MKHSPAAHVATPERPAPSLAGVLAGIRPDRLRGRVLAVEMVFISASNQLGAFESGMAAFLLGAVPAVVAGGALTIAIAIGWSRLFPALAAVDRLEEVRPVKVAPTKVPA